MSYFRPSKRRYDTRQIVIDKKMQDNVSLYRRLVQNIQKIYQISPDRINSALSCVFPKLNEDGDFYKLEFAIAYTMCYSPCHTELVRIHTRRFMYGLPEILTDREKTFNIVSLSGGPGDDIFGFISGLCGHQCPPRVIKATIVDRPQRFWLFFSEGISQILSFESTTDISAFLNVSGIIPAYIEATVENCDEETWRKIEKVVREADVVMMFSPLNRWKDKTQEVAEKVSAWMRRGSLLFLGERESFAIRDSSPIYNNFETVYSSYEFAHLPRSAYMFGRTPLLSSKGHAEFMRKRL